MNQPFTPEQQARIDRFNAIVQFASQQTGVVQITETHTQTIRLANGSTRTEVIGVILPAIMTNWQPPQETIDYPKEDEQDENPTPAPVSANGAHADV